jgi:hypothetical protein
MNIQLIYLDSSRILRNCDVIAVEVIVEYLCTINFLNQSKQFHSLKNTRALDRLLYASEKL